MSQPGEIIYAGSISQGQSGSSQGLPCPSLRGAAKLFLFALTVILSACTTRQTPPTLFQQLPSSYTNIDFSNDLRYDERFNIYTYRNFYNGGGVAIGDINLDGLPDIFFTANMLPNRLYLNKGNMQFEDITRQAGIRKKGKWSTGVSMADINGDGWLDIYVCNSGDVQGEQRENELYINNGNGTFTEKAGEYGLNDRGLSTHAAFFDYDHDGDLDMFLLNNSFKPIGRFNLQENERHKRDSVGGHKFFRNDGHHFTDISEAAGIYGSAIGFGLGVTVGDVDNDGWQDIYVCNDFFERDYLYINQHNGTFKECLEDQMYSISSSSMGADMADINNDGAPEVFVTEMLPEDNARLKTNTTFENWDKYQLNLRYDYYHQFTRNTLQLNNGNNTFSEIGRFAGVAATDWSWGALIADLDNDGRKDIFVANGIYQDLTNEDYIQYISNETFFKEIVAGKANFKKLIDLIPSRPVASYAFCNNGDLTFTNKAAEWGLDQPGFSNGAAYADLDNDGDLDLVVNNVNMPCFIYRNETMQQYPGHAFLKVSLDGQGNNRFGIGANVTVYYNNTIACQEQMPMRGFQSTVDHRLNFGLGRTTGIDSVVVKWPDGKANIIHRPSLNTHITVKQSEALPAHHTTVTPAATLFTAGNNNYGIDFIHHENEFADFDRDRLIYHMLSTAGPRIAKGDVNKDGLEDIFICGAKDQAGALYVQGANGHFRRTNEALLEKDKVSEDTDALFFDADGDGDADLYVCSGGNEFAPGAAALTDRLYINDGKGLFSKAARALPSGIFESSSCVRAADYDGDGDLDLFVGVRLIPHQYGYPCNGYLLNNNGKGVFTDQTSTAAPGLLKTGMMTDAAWTDIDNDAKPDLVLCGEYMPVRIFYNQGGRLEEITTGAGLEKSKGWWNRLAIADVNGDGYPDIVAANHGLNSPFKATAARPVCMYTADFDNSGAVKQILTCYNKDTAYPLVLRHDLISVIPHLKKKYLQYEQYKQQRIEDIFTPAELNRAVKMEAYTLQSAVLINNRKGGFTMEPLPAAAQFSPMYGMVVADYDGDGKTDILMGGNFYQSKPEAGIYDASYGTLLKGDGKGHFSALTAQQSGIRIRGAVRDMALLKAGNRQLLLAAMNNEAVKVLVVNSLPLTHHQAASPQR